MAKDRAEIIKELQTREFVFVAYSQATKLPYVTCSEETFNDQAWIFASEEGVKAFGQKKLDEKILLMGMKYEKKSYPRLYGILYAVGINSVVWDDGEEQTEIELLNIAKQADFSNIDPANRPLLNPTLQLSGMYFMQELKRPMKEEERDNMQKLKEMEEELIANIVKSEFLVGVISNPEDPKKIQIPYLKNKEDKKYQPAFSDILEYEKFSRGKNMRMFKVPFKKLPELMVKESDAMVINPLGFNLVLTRQMLDMIMKQLA